MTTAVLDIGKTNVKLIVLDDEGGELHVARRTNRVEPGPPYPHFDAGAIWAWILEALRGVPDRRAIATIVPVTHGATAAMLAGDRLALPILDYEHAGPAEATDRYRAVADDYASTFSPPLPLGLNLGRQIFWQATRFPEAFARVTDILMYPQYWAWRLTGAKASEVTSLGCHTDLWRPREARLSGLVERAGWSALFPPLRAAWEVLGPLDPEVAEATGLPATCRVLTGIHDSNASYLAYLARAASPFTVVSSGTWVICMAAGGRLDRLAAERDMLANVDATGAPVPTGRFMGGREYEAILGTADDPEASLADLDAVLAKGTLALPSFAPESGPFPGRPGRIVGRAPEGSGERAALAALYAALMLDFVLEQLGASGPIFIDGPYARNALISDSLATLRPDQPVHAMAAASGAAGGAFLLTRWPAARRQPADLAPARQPLATRAAALRATRLAWRSALAG
ncbi:MAG TPA: FGGY family carbohydrate kinase [Geminicoccaceae bacterium]|nr:FGGY family carbohydrate kinase [Geminicoccaceae bacterium]